MLSLTPIMECTSHAPLNKISSFSIETLLQQMYEIKNNKNSKNRNIEQPQSREHQFSYKGLNEILTKNKM